MIKISKGYNKRCLIIIKGYLFEDWVKNVMNNKI